MTGWIKRVNPGPDREEAEGKFRDRLKDRGAGSSRVVLWFKTRGDAGLGPEPGTLSFIYFSFLSRGDNKVVIGAGISD